MYRDTHSADQSHPASTPHFQAQAGAPQPDRVPGAGGRRGRAAENLRERTQPSVLPQRQLRTPLAPGDGGGQRGRTGPRLAAGEDCHGGTLAHERTHAVVHAQALKLHTSDKQTQTHGKAHDGDVDLTVPFAANRGVYRRERRGEGDHEAVEPTRPEAWV